MSAVAIWGRSLATRFPKDIVEKLKLEAGDEVQFVEKNNEMVIQKATKKRPTLDDLLATVPKGHKTEDAWKGMEESVGSEIW